MGRTNVEPIKDWRILCEKIGDAIIEDVKNSGTHYLLHGHSFGALLAYLTAVHIREKKFKNPIALVVGNKTPPHLFSESVEGKEKLIHDFSKEYYMKNFAHGAPKGYLEIPGILDMICPPLQIDLGINQKFWWNQLSDSEKRPLPFPVHACRGETDDRTSENDMLEWENIAGSIFQYHQYKGNHFFLNADQSEAELLEDISEIIKKVAKWEPWMRMFKRVNMS